MVATHVINQIHAAPSIASPLLGMCGFFRKDQFPSGVYSFSENLMRGFAKLRSSGI